MGAFTAGSVALIHFPFSDLSRTKLRPAVVLAALDGGDYILCQITSKPYDPCSLELLQNDFCEGSLNRVSYIRPGKLFTSDQSLLVKQIGKLSPVALNRLREKVIQVISSDSKTL